MKHYINIEHLRETDTDTGNGMILPKNDMGYAIGDHIQITEKIDGLQGSIQIDNQTGKILAFSKHDELSQQRTMHGFWNYVQTLNPFLFSPHIIVFGEWTGIQKRIVYHPVSRGRWYIFDIYDTIAHRYWKPYDVRRFCILNKLYCVNALYDGPFQGWNHVREYLHKPTYGKQQEGIVIRNISKLLDPKNTYPVWLKIENTEFSELDSKDMDIAFNDSETKRGSASCGA